MSKIFEAFLVKTKGRAQSWLATLAGLVLVVGLGGCDCSPETLSLVISQPTNDQVLGPDADEDLEMAGLQFTVVIATSGLSADDEVSLLLDMQPEMGSESLMPLATGTPDAATGEVSLSVTLPAGPHALVACARDCAVVSLPVAFTVNAECATVDWVAPSAPSSGAALVLGPDDDTDGESCGETFTTDIRIFTDAPDGGTAQLYVNGTPRAMATITDRFATFTGVNLDNRGETGNMVEVEVINDLGATCRIPYPVEIYVDCAGVSCSITQPDTESGFLNQSDDSSMDPGFQGTFAVSTDGTGDDLMQDILLVVDGDETNAAAELPVLMGEMGVATFTGVALTEGTHRVQAICSDASGNRTRSGVAEWVVDITPCDASIAEPMADAVFNDSDDLDMATEGVQIAASGMVSGDACTSVEVGVCGSVGAGAMLTGQDWSGTLSLASSPTQEICAQVTDEAGNVGEARVSVRLRTAAPQLEITSPTAGTAYNAAGTMGRTADLDDTSEACDIAVTVSCTEVGVDVTLLNESSGETLEGGTATCEAMAGLPLPFTGVATFPGAVLPSLNDGSSVNIVARQENDRLVGLSAPISVTPDCDAPGLIILAPSCGSVLRPSSDDLDPATPEFEYRVRVLNTSLPRPTVELTVLDADTGMPVGATETSDLPASGAITEFYPLGSMPAGATFGSRGSRDLQACATDSAGNRGCAASCPLTVADLPIVTITSPADGSTLTSTDDCDDIAPGLQIRVNATTDAADGSGARIEVGGGSLTTAVVGGAITGCLSAADGRDVSITVSVNDASRGMASDTNTVDVDTTAPTDAINLTDPVTISDVRGGVARFEWTAVDDSGFVLESYELRCSNRIINSETRWADATVVPVTTVPAAGGTSQSEEVSGFPPGTSLECSLRGRDAAGDLTPIGVSADVDNDMRSTTTTLAGMGSEFVNPTMIGDVNGDGLDDVLISGGASSATAHLVFGNGASGVGATPNVTITLPSSVSLPHASVGLGDFNGDGIADFAISTPSGLGFGGQAWILFGRPSTSPWPAGINLTAGCAADVCLSGTTTFGLLGTSLGAVDFNGDSLMDLAISAPTGTPNGQVYVVLGSAGFVSGSSFDLGATGTAPNGFVIAGPSGQSRFGFGLTSPGDLGGDGPQELVIGSPNNPGLTGRVDYVLGRAYPAGGSGLEPIGSGDLLAIATGAGASFGERVAALGDFNGDSRVDLAVRDATATGEIYIYLQQFGGTFSGSAIVVENDLGRPSDNYYGGTLGLGYHPWFGTVGDFNGDRLADLLTGSKQRNIDSAAPRTAGACEVVLGSGTPGYDPSRRLNVQYAFQPAGTAGDRRAAAFVGDVNGDGNQDIFCADPNSGQGYILY